MATIVKRTAQELINPDAGGMPQPRLDTSFAGALQSFGSSLGNLGEVIAARKQKKEDFATRAAYRNFDLQMGELLRERAENIAPDGEGFHDDFMTNVFNPARRKFLEGLPARLRPEYEALLGEEGPDTTGWSIKAAETERDQTYKWFSDELSTSKEQLATAISLDPEGYDKLLQQGMAEIDASGLPTAQKMEHKRDWEKLAQLSVLNRLLETNPEGVIRELGGDPRYLSPTSQFEILRNALIQQESSGRASVISPAGAIGLMQIMPGTAIEIAKELKDPNFNPKWNGIEIAQFLQNPANNIRYGDYYLKKMIKRFGKQGGLEAALIAYNGGPSRAKKWIENNFDDSVLPEETRKYYKAVMEKMKLPTVRSTSKNDPKGVSLVFDSGYVQRATEHGSTPDESGLNPDLVERVKVSFAGLGLDTVKVKSGHRSEAHNKAAEGAPKSQHVGGNAIDIDVRGYTVEERKQIIRMLSANGITGIGVGANIIHADLGGRRAWGYANAAGGGKVPAAYQDVIDEHLSGKAEARGIIGLSGRYSSLPVSERQRMINAADQEITRRYNETSKGNAVQRQQLRQAIANEYASLERSGVSTEKVNEEDIATMLGEDDYNDYIRRRDVALKTYNAKLGIVQMTHEEMGDRLDAYRPDAGSPTYADDQRVYDAVQKEVDRVTKLRSAHPDRAALEFEDVREAYDRVDPAKVDPQQVDPGDMQEFVRLMLERQKEFNLKPGTAAPVPREWGLQIGRALARVPELMGKNAADVNAAIAVQYIELQKIFGDYTDEIFLYALQEYTGVGPNTAELIKGYMEAIAVGGDPFKLRPRQATDMDDVEGMSWFSGVSDWMRDFFAGEDVDESLDGGGAVPEPSAPEGITNEERLRRELADEEEDEE